MIRKVNRIYARLFASAWALALIMALGSLCIKAQEKKLDPKITGHEQLQFEGLYKADAIISTTTNAGAGEPRIHYMRTEIPAFSIPPYKGERYTVLLPDTIDLAENCRKAVHCLTSLTDPKLDYDTYFSGGPPHCFSDICGVKWQEALPLMRIASGNTESMQVDEAWMKSQLKSIGPDGLFYINRPYLPDKNISSWVTQVATADGIVPLKGHKLDQFCETVVQGRILNVFTIYYLRDKNPMWLEAMRKMVDAFDNLTINKGDYAYMPLRVYEPGAKILAGAPMPTEMGAEELGGRFIGGLAEYYRVTGYEPARKLDAKLVKYFRHLAKYYDEQGRYAQAGTNNMLLTGLGHFAGHSHGICFMLEYAIATHDSELIEFVNKSYEWARANTYGCLETGWFPEIVEPAHSWSEPCCYADMIAQALKLSELGAGDYWDDADRWIRNQLVEGQSEGGGYGPGCCTGNATRALYYAWSRILGCKDGNLRVNLLMNRASKWADVNSCIPYEGRVEIKLKQPMKTVALRVPEWIKNGDKEVACKVGDAPRELNWTGRYVNLGEGRPDDTFTMTFPIAERTVKGARMAHAVEFTLIIKGNDVVSIDPRGKEPSMPPYQRDKYRENKTRWIKRERFAPVEEIQW